MTLTVIALITTGASLALMIVFAIAAASMFREVKRLEQQVENNNREINSYIDMMTKRVIGK